MTGLLATRFSWPDLAGQRALVVGLGGGSDAITAYAIARGLGAHVAYANTKHALDADLILLSPHIGRLPDRAPIAGTTKIERRLPRGPHGSPLVLACGRDEPTAALARELAALAFDCVIGVDTGGDALDTSWRGSRGRDRRMVDVLGGLGVPVLLAVVAPGSDGQQSRDAIEAAIDAAHAAGRYLGAFSLAPYVPILRDHGRYLGADRTPNIICQAFDDARDPVEVPRGQRPRIARSWLTSGLVFAIATAEARGLAGSGAVAAAR